jgi:hypothetical protein
MYYLNGLHLFVKSKLPGDYFSSKKVKNIRVMIVGKFMADLLNYTKKIAERIAYYDAIVDFTDESHWFNPFYKQPDVTVVWVENPKDDEWFA